MSALAKNQAALADVMRRAGALTSDPYGGAIAAEIAAGNERLSPVEQVDIYREQFFLRHVDALRDDMVRQGRERVGLHGTHPRGRVAGAGGLTAASNISSI